MSVDTVRFGGVTPQARRYARTAATHAADRTYRCSRLPGAIEEGQETMSGPFSGKVALVTGAASGIGRASALRFAALGATVVVVDIDGAGAKETVRLVHRHRGHATQLITDVTRSLEVAAMVEAAVTMHGRLDFAYNNAGIEGIAAPPADYPEDEFDAVIATNLKSVWLCMRHEVPRMLERGGAIVNTASVAGLKGSSRSVAYTASKHAVLGMTKSFARAYAPHGIRVNAVCPAVIRTPMAERSFRISDPQNEAVIAGYHPLGRLGTPEDVAEAVAWLCSDQASFITGQALAVDGGWLL